MTQLRIPAVYMRGGTSKGVFFLSRDLPADLKARERLLLRVIGSPDRYGKQTDGMGGATSSTSKIVILSKSDRPDCDVDYLFGQVAIDAPVIDWSGNCGNLTTAVGPFAIGTGLVDAPADGTAVVRIWQANIGRKIVSHVPMQGGEVRELGDFELDGVAFPAAEVRLEFLDPAADEGDSEGGAMFPTGNRVDSLDVPGVGRIEATLINAGNPTIFVDAVSLGLSGTELQKDINGDAALLARAEAVRALGAVAMGLVKTAEEATATRQHTPKMTGTGAVALAAAAAIPGTVVQRVASAGADGRVRFGHPSGSLAVGAEAREENGQWAIKKVVMSRSARRLMEGWVRVPAT